MCIAAAGGCAARRRPPDLPPRASLDVPFFGDRDNFCGPSSLAMVLAHAGVPADVPELVTQVYVPGRGGSLQIEMLAAPRAHGLVGMVLPPRLEAVLREIAHGTPVVLLVNLGLRSVPAWHYLVAIGYDLEAGELLVHSAPHAAQRMRFDRAEYLWRDSGFWSMVAVPPARVPATARMPVHAAAVAAFERSGRLPAAQVAWDAHLSRWPESALGWFALGNLAHRDGRMRDAERSFREAVRIEPGFVPALNNLALVLGDLGRVDEAIWVAEQALSSGGPHLEAVRTTLSTLRAQAGDAGRSRLP